MSSQKKFNDKRTAKPKTTVPQPPLQKKQKTSAPVTFCGWKRWTVPCVLFLIFAGFAFWLLVSKNSEYLYTAQEHSLWVGDTSFWNDKMMYAGGLAQWLGCFLTQFFYEPWWGVICLIVLWAIIFALLMKTAHVATVWSIVAIIPLFALLLSEVDMGYWIYYLKQPGYWFTQPVSILIALLFTWRFQVTNKVEAKVVLWQCVYIVVATALLYPLIGSWALIAAAWMGIMSLDLKNREFWPTIVAVASIVVVPIIYYQFYTRMRIEDAWTVNFPIFQNDTVYSYWLSVPFILTAVWPLVLMLFRQRKEQECTVSKKGLGWWILGNAAAMCGLVWLTTTLHYDNYNYKAEMRIYRAIDESRFDDVLSEVRKAPGNITRQMVLAKNIALMHKGTCGNEIFRYPNTGEPPYVFDSLRVHLVQTCGTQLYYNYGKCNFACRWAIENSVEFGFDMNQLKILTRTSMMSGEFKAAQKYLNILHNTTFQRKWAEEWQAMLDNKHLYYQSVEYKNVHPMTLFNNTLDGDEGLCEMYLINYFSHVHKSTPKLQEQTLVFSLIQKDIQLFWPRFFRYASLHEQEQMPIHYQEAAYLYGHLEHEVDISGMPFDQERIVNRYASFDQITQKLLAQGMTAQQVGQATKDTFGDTFWWFYFFCRDIHSY
ncbi:MAG: DUF6057 family protein [Bacteroidales bacterium]|nr:DUF6057 family protein [Bacteroidales bacterium]